MKVIYCYKRKPGMSVQAFQSYMATDRPRTVAAMPGAARYEQNLTKPSGYGRTVEPIFDGLEKFWFDTDEDLRAFEAALPSADFQADLGRFVDGPRTRRVLTAEVMIKDGPRTEGMTRLIEFLTRRPGMEIDAFHWHWSEVHGPLVARQRQIRSYIQSHTLESEYRRGEPDFDGVTEVWFDATDAMREAASEPLWTDVLADEKNFVCDHTPFIISIDRTVAR